MSRHAAKVTSKGQVTIPKPIRELMELQEGDYLVMECDDDRLIVRKAAVSPTEDFDRLAERVARRFRDRGISKREVEEAIRAAREGS